MIEGPQIPKSTRTYTAQGSDVYVVKLTTGTEINSEDDLTSLYHGFVLPSWMSDRAKVKISERRPNRGLTEVKIDGETKPLRSFHDKCFSYEINVQLEDGKGKSDKAGKFLFEEERKEEVIEKNSDKMEKLLGGSITYQVSTIPKSSNSYKITVEFSKSKEEKIVTIQIKDPYGFLKLLPKAKSHEQTEAEWLRKNNELYYPYIEPENIRTVETKDKPHLHIAFRGGGAKGAAYVGAVKALLDENPGAEIKSIIGSSAGGIIALAMAARCETSELIEHCKKMTEIPRDTTIKFAGVDEMDDVKDSLWKLMDNLAIIPHTKRGLFDDLFKDKGFVEALLTWLGSLAGIDQMFDIQVGDRKRRLNYYGLLIGHLLAGEVVQRIALNVIDQFLDKPWQYKEGTSTTNRQKLRQLYPRVERAGDSKTLTMEQFYALTGVEFTVTGTDITSKILRFFNHKTTPSLPVYKAVILTGSFPVAFEAQKWKSQWGKYYIHYERWRREIDLTGHQITDGGMLANFPIEYLDNESMRPMYFSHKGYFEKGKEKNHTIIRGFGLDDSVIDPQEKEKCGQEPKKTHWQILREKYLTNQLAIKYVLQFNPTPKIIKASDLLDTLKKIPLLSFLYQLLQTYIAAGGNLVQECFESKICLESPCKPLKQKLHTPPSFTPTRENIEKQIKRLNQSCCSTDFKKVKQLVKQVHSSLFKALRKELSNKNFLQQFKEMEIMKKEQGRLLSAVDKVDCKDLIIKCSQPIESTTLLRNECINFLNGVSSLLQKIDNPQSIPNLGDHPHQPSYEIAEFQRREPQIRRYILEKMHEAKSVNLHLVFQSASQNSLFSYQIFKLVEDCLFRSDQSIQRKLKSIAEFILKTVTLTDRGSEDQNTRFKQQVTNGLMQWLREKFDEGTKVIKLKELNYDVPITNPVEVVTMLKQIRWETGKVENHKIAAVTCGSTHSMLGFLLATGYGSDQVQTEMEEIDKYFKLDMNIIKESLEQVKSSEWGLPDRFKINKKFQQIIWKGKTDFFKQLEVIIEEEESGPSKSDIEKKKALLEKIQTLKEKFEEQKESVLNSFDSVLEHLLVSVEDCQVEGFTEQLSKEMGLKKKKYDYGKLNASDCERSKDVINLILDAFGEEIRFLLYLFANQAQTDFILSCPHQDQKDMWKCMVITRFLTADKVKNKVQSILKSLCLPINIGLRDFYNMAPRTIELTFPAVDLSNKKMRFINQKTFPHMPVWAAVVIGSSLPMLFPLVKVQPSWGTDVKVNSNIRVLENLFGDGKVLRSTKFASGNLVSTFPLDLLTNHAVQKRFYKEQDYTMLCFGDSQEGRAKAEEKKMQLFSKSCLSIKYPTCFQIATIVWKCFRGLALDFKKSVRGNVLMTYMESHDNLVIDLYKNDLLELPVRLSTLGFDKLKPDEEGGNRYSAFADLLNETYFTTKEKFQQPFQKNAVTYIRAQVDKEGILVPEKEKGIPQKIGSAVWGMLFKPSKPERKYKYENVIALEFISKERQCKDLKRKYKIEYKLNNSPQDPVKWLLVNNQKITFKRTQKKVSLRFTYPTKRNSEVGQQEVLTFSQSQFTLDVTNLQQLLKMGNSPKPIFALRYKNVLAESEISRPPCFSLTLDLSTQQDQPLLRGKSIVYLEKTGLYCKHCCGMLKPIWPVHPGRCDNKNHNARLKFGCKQWNKDEGKDHHQYCFECCKHFTVIRKGCNLYCEHNHLYEFHQFSKQQYGDVTCDICAQLIMVSYRDSKCDRDICTRCCLKFTSGVYSTPIKH